MKTKNYINALYAITALSVLSTAHSQTWETADSITYPTAGPSAQVDDIAVAPDGAVYAIGSSLSASGTFEANYVRRSLDGGSTWQSVASFSPVTGNGINKLAVDGTGRLYAAGLSNGVWTVLSSANQGANWSTVDSFNTGVNSNPELRDIATDSAGAVYIVGSATPSRGPRQWLVRKGVPSGVGLAWSTVDVYTVDKTYGAYPTSIAVKPSGGTSVEVFVGGAAQSSSGLNWLVRRSTDGGATWTTSDKLTSGIDGIQTLAIAQDGSVYSSGRIRTAGGSKRSPTTTTSFVMRKGVPSALSGGAITWTTQQTLPETSSATEFRPQGSVVDGFGRVFFAGYDVTKGANVWNYRVMVSVDGGPALSEADSFVGVAFCAGADAAGNVFTGGYFGTDMSNGGGIIRKLPTPLQ